MIPKTLEIIRELFKQDLSDLRRFIIAGKSPEANQVWANEPRVMEVFIGLIDAIKRQQEE